MLNTDSVSFLISDPYEVKRKTRLKSEVNLKEKPCVTGEVQTVSLIFVFLQFSM